MALVDPISIALFQQDVDEGILKRVLTCSKCGSGHDYFSEFLKSSCHETCNEGILGDFIDAPKVVVCSTCNASHATVGLYLKHIDSAELHRGDWFHCLHCTHEQGFPTIRYDGIPTSQIEIGDVTNWDALYDHEYRAVQD